MNNEFYKKLVDLYAGDELPEELASEMEAAAMADPNLSHDMFTLKKTVQLLKQQDEPAFTEESFHRILMKMRTRGAEIEQRSPEPAHWQYRLPIQS